MYLTKENIKTIQLDHTSRCNLMCPQCARVTETGELNPMIKDHKDLTVEDYRKIFSGFKGQLTNIIHCGNYGDSLASPTFDSVLEWCNNNEFNSTIITNGSLRNTDWWADLAKKNVTVVFSVDGLENTNHIYRVNSNFKKIKENMIAYAAAGGIARWDFLVFEHNKHQINEAMGLAKEIGIKKFNVKNTSRFAKETKYVDSLITKKNKIINDVVENPATKQYNSVIDQYGSFTNYTKQTTIRCKYQDWKTIYIDFNMRVWPCCWVGGPYLFDGSGGIQKKQILQIIEKFGETFNSLLHHSWDEILSHEFYAKYLIESWSNENRLFTCGRTCGENYEFTSGTVKTISKQ